MNSATAIANPNIAFIKYWGNRDQELRLPSNGSISMNLDGLHTRTQVTFNPGLEQDWLTLNGRFHHGPAQQRVSALLDRVRRLAALDIHAHVESYNNFPTGAGIASSASAFAALALAASRAAGLMLDEAALSRLARTASGSAARSIPGGYVEMKTGEDDHSAFAHTLAPANDWRLADCIAIVSREHKSTGSLEGHAIAGSSPLQAARVADTPRRLDICRNAIIKQDFQALAEIMELDSNMMHAVIMTSQPRLSYWQPATLAIMTAVGKWRQQGLPAAYTIDAGPNVHVICPAGYAAQVSEKLIKIPGVSQVLKAYPGGPAYSLSDKR
ncbi:diphosphomevalonate decarboxylase [Chloroflexota bacterium]